MPTPEAVRIRTAVTAVEKIVQTIVAVFIAVVISIYWVNDNTRDGCVRSSESKIIDAMFFDGAAEKNFKTAKAEDNKKIKDANNKAANDYVQYSIAKRMTIPMPSDWSGDPRTRGDSEGDRKRGCDEAYPDPIPFIS